MSVPNQLTGVVLLVMLASSHAAGPLQIIRDLVQFNIVGIPILHTPQAWNFDPDGGLKRARQYEEVNGVKGARHIERLGLGIDGHQEERLRNQRARDDGHLGGLNQYLP